MNNNLIINKMSTMMEMNPVNRLFFLIKVLLMFLLIFNLLVNKIFHPKWFTKVKIVVSPDYHLTVIAMINSGADMNCIQEGLIPSKYFEKSTERLVSANSSQMKIKYEIGRAHV